MGKGMSLLASTATRLPRSSPSTRIGIICSFTWSDLELELLYGVMPKQEPARFACRHPEWCASPVWTIQKQPAIFLYSIKNYVGDVQAQDIHWQVCR